MFGRRARKLELEILGLQSQLDALRELLIKKTSMAASGYHNWYGGPRIERIDHSAVLQHLLDKAGLALCYIEGRTAEDPRVGVEKIDPLKLHEVADAPPDSYGRTLQSMMQNMNVSYDDKS